MNKTKVSMLLLVITGFSLTGCATMFGDNSRAVQVTTVPAGATILVDNGATSVSSPTQVIVPTTWSPTVIHVQKEGYQSQTFVVDPIFQPVGLWNLIIWPGFIVDAISGDMMRVPAESRHYTAVLVPAN